ncbi:MAG TPA: hypothetical protein DCY02_07455, partial [Armatimonadetes bacterium]|nr:hypothetical protein [Armatimonadota bacterium]
GLLSIGPGLRKFAQLEEGFEEPLVPSLTLGCEGFRVVGQEPGLDEIHKAFKSVLAWERIFGQGTEAIGVLGVPEVACQPDRGQAEQSLAAGPIHRITKSCPHLGQRGTEAIPGERGGQIGP